MERNKNYSGFCLEVNYSLTTLEMIQLALFDDVTMPWFFYRNASEESKNNYLKGFPAVADELLGKKIKVIAELFQSNKRMTKDEVIAEMKKEGYRPANLQELLCFAADKSELQRKFPIAALGAIAKDDSEEDVILYISACGTQRFSPRKDIRHISIWSQEFPEGWNFLAVAV